MCLAEQIAKLKALVIPERFVAERLARDEQIGHCEDVITRWNKARGSVAVPVVYVEATLTSPDGTHTEHKESTVHATLCSPDDGRLELGSGITCDFETESPAPFVEFVNVTEAIAKARMYTRGNGGPVLKVIDGGKKS